MPDGACLIRVKAVPGARSTQIAGILGDRLKIRIAAPPEDGKANLALCAALAAALGLPERAITIAHGTTRPEKTIRAEGITASEAAARLGLNQR